MPRASPCTRRALRAAVVAVVALGYGLALGGTAWGAGLALLPHLATAHAPLEAPTLVEVPPSTEVLTTLRPEARRHAHGGSTHTHPPAAPTVRVGGEREADGWHTHGDEAHRHAPDPPAPAAPVVVALDKHRLPATPAAPALAATDVEWRTEETTAASVAPSVETPPPVRRG